MTDQPLQHRYQCILRLEPDADIRAPGGAITVALCGHWEHEGACRWPHFSSIEVIEGQYYTLIVEFDANEAEYSHVIKTISSALNKGWLVGPDQTRSVWTVDRSWHSHVSFDNDKISDK